MQQRIPVVSRPCIQPPDLISKSENTAEASLVIPLPLELDQLETEQREHSEQNIQDEAGNPFECLASFYFPEHIEFDKNENCSTVHSSHSSHINHSNQCSKSIWMDIQDTDRENSEKCKNVDYEASTSNEKIILDNNHSEVLTSVPNLMKILQAKSQKKIFLEERK